MKFRTVAIAGFSLLAIAAMPAVQASSKTLRSQEDKLSYTLGANMGQSFKKQNIKINTNALIQGLQDGLSGGKLQMSKQQMNEVLAVFQQDMMQKQAKQFEKAAKENKTNGEKYLAANKKKEGVVTTKSGLQYKVINPGKGQSPSDNDTVTVEYTGKLVDGTVFDSTEKSGKPATFKVSQVIPGWTEVLKLMQPGATWEVVIPSDLAYGPRGMPGPIGPNETLIFNIHLVSVDKASS